MTAVHSSDYEHVVVKDEDNDDVIDSISVRESDMDYSLDAQSESNKPSSQFGGEDMDASECSSPRAQLKHSDDEDEEEDYMEIEEERKFIPRRSARVKSKFMKSEDGDSYNSLTAGLARYYGTRFHGSRTPTKSVPTIRGTGDLPVELKQSLKQLKNFLKLSKARRWVYFEFFYSDVDRELFLGPSEFHQCLQECFPLLRQQKLKVPEWKHIKRLIGKPRRLSQVFLNAERQTVERKRQRIREIQKGSTVVLGNDLQLPSKIPRPLTVGSKVFAKIHSAKEGICIYAGTVNAVVEASYRIAFDKSIQPHIVPDIDVMAEDPSDLVSVSFFLEKNKAAQPLPFRSSGVVNVACPSMPIGADLSEADLETMIGHGLTTKQSGVEAEDKCGNYSLRVVTMLTKLHKLVERKRFLLNMLRQKNANAEKEYLHSPSGCMDYDRRLLYAKNVVKIAIINENLDQSLASVAEYVNHLLPHLTEVTLTSRPKTLRKLCMSRATQIFKQTNVSGANGHATGGNVINRESIPRPFKPRTSELIIAFCALSLQLKALCQEPVRTIYDFCTVRDTVKEIKAFVENGAKPYFEDMVELVIRRIEISASGEDPALLIR